MSRTEEAMVGNGWAPGSNGWDTVREAMVGTQGSNGWALGCPKKTLF